MQVATPRQIADRQLAAYNARDLEAFLALFDADARLIDLPSGNVLARGIAEIRTVYAARFGDNPDLHCTVHQRIDLATVAIDRETVTGIAIGTLDVVAMYDVRDGRIHCVHFVREARPSA